MEVWWIVVIREHHEAKTSKPVNGRHRLIVVRPAWHRK
jgi:hypothetical protein